MLTKGTWKRQTFNLMAFRACLLMTKKDKEFQCAIQYDCVSFDEAKKSDIHGPFFTENPYAYKGYPLCQEKKLQKLKFRGTWGPRSEWEWTLGESSLQDICVRMVSVEIIVSAMFSSLRSLSVCFANCRLLLRKKKHVHWRTKENETIPALYVLHLSFKHQSGCLVAFHVVSIWMTTVLHTWKCRMYVSTTTIVPKPHVCFLFETGVPQIRFSRCNISLLEKFSLRNQLSRGKHETELKHIHGTVGQSKLRSLHTAGTRIYSENKIEHAFISSFSHLWKHLWTLNFALNSSQHQSIDEHTTKTEWICIFRIGVRVRVCFSDPWIWHLIP